jgi:S-DNA-T family DNA segregation ATPase FtsK/SpoIIIE
MILIDPKLVERKIYNGIPHLLTPVITEAESALNALRYCVREMERRYALLDKASARNIKSYNKTVAEKGGERLPYLVVIIDEFADLMAASGKDLEAAIVRLASMSRAVGIHLVLATQRPSADVITGLIKSNIPARIAFMVAAMTDSRIIIDSPGAEKLLGKGDMLFSSAANPFPVRAQGAFVSEEEAEKAAAHLRSLGTPEYVDIK